MITLTGLTKVFPVAGRDVTALQDIDLTVHQGAIHGVVGHSGAGKSTLVRCLTGLERPTSGSVRIGDQVISDLAERELRWARRRIGMVFQHVNLLDSRSAAENVSLALEVAGVPRAERRQRVAELLDTVGLTARADSYPAQLSGGERQRVGIARALATEPQVLLFDEPTSALDPLTTRQVLELIRSLRDRLGITMVIITHDMRVVREVCDAVTWLRDGQVAESGTLADVLRSPGSALAKELVPLPAGSAGGGAVVEVAFTGDAASARDVLAVLNGGSVHADIVAGTIETVAGHRVARLRLDLEHTEPEALDRALHVLDGAGLHAEVVA